MRVLIADSVARVRHALGVMLRQWPGLELVGEATDMSELLTELRKAHPDTILLDWRLRGQSGGEAVRSVRSCCPTSCVIVLSDRPEAREQALAAGADTFVSKIDPPERLMDAIEQAAGRSGARV